jgi:regulatory protein
MPCAKPLMALAVNKRSKGFLFFTLNFTQLKYNSAGCRRPHILHMTAEGKNTRLTPSQALIRAASYCAYQERCHEEVKEKLASWGVYGPDAGEIMHKLVEQNYLDEERFARAFAGGKFRTKKWGRIKISLELKARKVSEYCIRQGLSEIDEKAYAKTLNDLAEEKYNSLTDRNPLVRKKKTATYLAGKGFEVDKVWDALSDFSA